MVRIWGLYTVLIGNWEGEKGTCDTTNDFLEEEGGIKGTRGKLRGKQTTCRKDKGALRRTDNVCSDMMPIYCLRGDYSWSGEVVYDN